jgi:hypothetical protein
MSRLMVHPKFSEWIADPVMMAKIKNLQANPNAALQSAIGDPSMHPVLEAALGLKLGNPADFGAGGDEEEDGDQGEDRTAAARPAAKPASTTKPSAPPPRELTEEEKKAAEVTAIRNKVIKIKFYIFQYLYIFVHGHIWWWWDRGVSINI